MSDTNLAQEATGSDKALSVEDGADAISDLLKDPVTDLSEEDQGDKGAEAGPSDEGEQPDPEGEATDDAPEEEATEEVENGPQESDSGRFAADNANVRLKDGSVISVQDLKRGYLSQQSFTRGTQENAKEREALASRKSEVDKFAQDLQQQRDFILQVAQHFTPQPPDRSLLDQNSANYDPFRYAALKAEYDDQIGVLGQLQQATQAQQAKMAEDQKRQQQDLRKKEADLLLDVMPELKKPEVYRKFWSDAVDTMAEYGFSEDDLNNAIDHRFYKVFRDLSAYRRARKQVPAVKEAVRSKPVLTGKRRMDPKDKTSRESQARREQLRQTGDFEAGVRSLMDIPDL